ncbi:SDR family oxidoreductase [Lysinibacillus sp. Bpr_S20]|uniref:SDR family NAD(P)-dependent oxidoreductase n=1 Tax=Lysinibacillus sp. Bpr_S20 TaxID=2933964 RepID=UPI0020136AAE|nr:SDR family oxidoreductase [Lysinibacillus sp. Bpr_S20]MCL1702617.1 SDR family oxidoreductase [Lysinibacillus sp. Bpr_S20]
MFLNLKGKTALVTGSTAGIGKAIAKSLVAEGVTVIINGRHEEKVHQTIQEIRDQYPEAVLQSLVSDLGTAQGCQKAIDEFREVDILINNLGIFEPREYFNISDEEWLKMFEVNIMSGVRLTRWYLNQMIQKKEGRVIFIASEAAIMPSQEMAHYSATKTMQLSLSRSLAELTKETNATVNTIMPGSTFTEGVETMLNTLYPNENLSMAEAEARFMIENRPTSIIQRLIRPEEIANFVTFLSSPLSSAINGSALRIDGGLVRMSFKRVSNPIRASK